MDSQLPEIVDAAAAMVASGTVESGDQFMQAIQGSLDLADYLWFAIASEQGVTDFETGSVDVTRAQLNVHAIQAQSQLMFILPGLAVVNELERSDYLGVGYLVAALDARKTNGLLLDMAVRKIGPQYQTLWDRYRPYFTTKPGLKEITRFVAIAAGEDTSPLYDEDGENFMDFGLGAAIAFRAIESDTDDVKTPVEPPPSYVEDAPEPPR